MKNKIVFLILNYETYWETNKCIESIYRTLGKDHISGNAHEIVIVDNGSENESFFIFKKIYGNTDGIHILKTNENLGFAKGNNFGFRYAKERLDPDFIAMINSDIIMTDANFAEKLVKNFDRYRFAVAGPNVRQRSGAVLAGYSCCLDQEDVKKRMKVLELQITLCRLKVEPICAVWQRIMGRLQVRKEPVHRKAVLNLEEGEQLHGCFLIFSRVYIDLFDGIYDKTFLYGEEILLRLRCKRSGLKMCYLEDIEAIHHESRTDKFINKGIVGRHLKRYINMRNAMGVILEYMDSDDL